MRPTFNFRASKDDDVINGYFSNQLLQPSDSDSYLTDFFGLDRFTIDINLFEYIIGPI